jgi:hypothetical protein
MLSAASFVAPIQAGPYQARPLRLRPGSPPSVPPSGSPRAAAPASLRCSGHRTAPMLWGRMPVRLEGSLPQTRGRVVFRRPTTLWPPVRGSLPVSHQQRFVVYRNLNARVNPYFRARRGLSDPKRSGSVAGLYREMRPLVTQGWWPRPASRPPFHASGLGCEAEY